MPFLHRNRCTEYMVAEKDVITILQEMFVVPGSRLRHHPRAGSVQWRPPHAASRLVYLYNGGRERGAGEILLEGLGVVLRTCKKEV